MGIRRIAEDGAIRVREFAEGDTASVLDLLQGAFGRWPEIETVTPEEFFRWKFTQCPFGPAMVRVVELDGTLAGMAAYMPWKFRDGQREVRALRGVDVAVDAAHRGRGVSMAIRSAARFEEDFEFVWSNPNSASHPGAVKAGRRTVTLPRFIGPGAPLSMIAPAAARGARSRPLPGASAAEVLAETGEVEALLSRVSAVGGRVSTAKDLPYLRWRYGSFERYRAVRVGSPGYAGIAIFRPRSDGRVVHVCEMIVQDGDRRSALRLLGMVRAECGAPILNCRFPTAIDAARAGFVPRLRRDVVDVHLLQGEVLPDPCDRASWSLSLGDLELL